MYVNNSHVLCMYLSTIQTLNTNIILNILKYTLCLCRELEY